MSSIRPATGRFAVPALIAAAFALALLAKPVQDRIDRQRAPASDPDLLYFTSPEMVRVLSLGYDSLVADVYWMRAIQYYGRRDEADRRLVRYKNLAPLLDIVTTLDPLLIDAYRCGSLFLSEPDPVGAGQPEAAVRLLDKGIAQHPGEWRLLYDKGFVYFWFLKDFTRAGDMWLLASRVAGAPAWMEGLAASALSRGGAVETARTLWERQYEESTRADLKANAKNHLDSLQVNEDLWALEFFIGKYRKATGGLPSNLQDLLRVGLIRRIPVDPSGVPYAYDAATGTAQLSIGTRVKYLSIPYDYREAFLNKLAQKFGG